MTTDERGRRHPKDEDPAPKQRREDEDVVTAGKGIGDELGLDQPTDEKPTDEGAGREEPTPNPAEIAP